MYTIQIIGHSVSKEELLNILQLAIDEARLTDDFYYEIESNTGLEIDFELKHEPLQDLRQVMS